MPVSYSLCPLNHGNAVVNSQSSLKVVSKAIIFNMLLLNDLLFNHSDATSTLRVPWAAQVGL